MKSSTISFKTFQRDQRGVSLSAIMIERIQEAINRQVNFSDREQAEAKLNECLNVVGLTAKLRAESLGNLERAKAKVLKNNPDLNSRLLKMKIDANTVDEQEELELAESLSTALYKTIDGLKSLLSIQEKDIIGWK